MTLIVDVTAGSSFVKDVEDALTKMCGCQSVAVDAVTGKVSTGAMTCACYCDHPAGCNLLTDLVGDTRSITITYSEFSSAYLNDQIWWYTREVNFGDSDVCGGTKMAPSISLAHELVHALFDSIDEDQAVRGENQIRLERCMPMRTEYADTPVANFRVGVLDDSNRPEYGCSCPPLRGGFKKATDRLKCQGHSKYCIPKTYRRGRPNRPGGAT